MAAESDELRQALEQARRDSAEVRQELELSRRERGDIQRELQLAREDRMRVLAHLTKEMGSGEPGTMPRQLDRIESRLVSVEGLIRQQGIELATVRSESLGHGQAINRAFTTIDAVCDDDIRPLHERVGRLERSRLVVRGWATGIGATLGALIGYAIEHWRTKGGP